MNQNGAQTDGEGGEKERRGFQRAESAHKCCPEHRRCRRGGPVGRPMAVFRLPGSRIGARKRMKSCSREESDLCEITWVLWGSRASSPNFSGKGILADVHGSSRSGPVMVFGSSWGSPWPVLSTPGLCWGPPGPSWAALGATWGLVDGCFGSLTMKLHGAVSSERPPTPRLLRCQTPF